MTAIRKSRLQYIHFQCLTIKTTKIDILTTDLGLCRIRSSVFLLLYHAKFMVKYWNYRPYHVSISYHGTVKPVESEYGAVSFTMTSTQEYQAIPCISLFGRSRDTYFFLLRS